jgi:hypothetical protein
MSHKDVVACVYSVRAHVLPKTHVLLSFFRRLLSFCAASLLWLLHNTHVAEQGASEREELQSPSLHRRRRLRSSTRSKSASMLALSPCQTGRR